jgi:hypothetical protein
LGSDDHHPFEDDTMTTQATSLVPQTPDEMVAQLQEIARVASAQGKLGAALQALRDIARLQGLLPARPPRSTTRKLLRREPTLLEAATAIAAQGETKK